ncbi:hypothetical protein [Aestuariivita sp.]|jgi:hypothetical protein|uniref:hypothetical protein n=1 Tax=Aestuariivita sp. TaxID=1872407 RepID=UPI0021704EB4|nr:hypothetical protein [Aestuariivita sp.]MCE8007936.1 hypothetical protein [Aestuariivita sp.]
MSPKLHAAAGAIALLTISAFWLGTVTSELFGSHATIAQIKTGILYGMVVLIPAMATAGSTGARLGKGWRLPQVAAKLRRMKIIAANGLLVLLPSAVFLAFKARAGMFDTSFYAVQGIELVAGALNITLLARNMADGLAISRRRSAKARG